MSNKSFKNEDVIKDFVKPGSTVKEAETKEKNSKIITLSMTESFYAELKKHAQERELSVNSYIKTVVKDSFK